MVSNCCKYPIKIFLLFFIIGSLPQQQSEAASQELVRENNPFEQLILSVNEKLNVLSDLLLTVEKFKNHAHELEMEKLDKEFISGTELKNEVEKGLEQKLIIIDTATSENDLKTINNALNTFIQQLNDKIDELTVFIHKFDQILQDKKRVLVQINSTSEKLSVTQKKLKIIQNKVDINTLCNQMQFAEKKQETAKNEYENNNILLALSLTLKVRHIVDEIYQNICSIEKNHTFKKRTLNFLEYTDNMFEYYKNNEINNASDSSKNKFNTARQTQENAYLLVENNPETAMYTARQARQLLLEIHGFYDKVLDDNDTVSGKKQVLLTGNFEKSISNDTADIISWNFSTSGNALYNTFAPDQYIKLKSNTSHDNSRLDSTIQEYGISGYVTASLKWCPTIPIIKTIKPNITLSQSRCNLGNDITLDFFNNLLTVYNILDGTILLNQKTEDSSNSVFCGTEIELKKNYPFFSFNVTGDFTFEEFIHPRTGYAPYKKYTLNTNLNFNSKDLSKSLLLKFTCLFNDNSNPGKSDLFERNYFFYEPGFEIGFFNTTNNMIFNGFYNWESFTPSQITTGYLNPAEIQNGKLDVYFSSQPLQWLNIELKGDFNYKNTLIRDKERNPSFSDSSTSLIPAENQYLYTYSLSPVFTIKPYSIIGLSLLFEYEGQKFKIIPEIDKLHTLKSYYAMTQGMRLFHETDKSLIQIAYYFNMNTITKRGEYNNESDYWELKLPFEWKWNPLEWLSVNLGTEFSYLKQHEKKIQKLKREKYFSISLQCGVQL